MKSLPFAVLMFSVVAFALLIRSAISTDDRDPDLPAVVSGVVTEKREMKADGFEPHWMIEVKTRSGKLWTFVGKDEYDSIRVGDGYQGR